VPSFTHTILYADPI